MSKTPRWLYRLRSHIFKPQTIFGQPALLHITHAKAGSTWLQNIFMRALPKAQVPRRIGSEYGRIENQVDTVYTAIFAYRSQMEELNLLQNNLHFFVMRDLRDTLTSRYFSERYSHAATGNIPGRRAIYQGMSDEEGLFTCFRDFAKNQIRIQESWLNSDSPVFKYETLFASKGEALFEIFEQIGYQYDRAAFTRAIEKSHFEKEYGRQPGDTDIHSHGRSGLPGDWKRYVTPELEAFIESELKDHLILSEYWD